MAKWRHVCAGPRVREENHGQAFAFVAARLCLIRHQDVCVRLWFVPHSHPRPPAQRHRQAASLACTPRSAGGQTPQTTKSCGTGRPVRPSRQQPRRTAMLASPHVKRRRGAPAYGHGAPCVLLLARAAKAKQSSDDKHMVSSTTAAFVATDREAFFFSLVLAVTAPINTNVSVPCPA